MVPVVGRWLTTLKATLFLSLLATLPACTGGEPKIDMSSLITNSVTINNPSNGTILRGNGLVGFDWQVIALASLDPNPITLEYSLDTGSTWNTIVGGLPNVSPYGWTVPTVDNPNVYVRVVVLDAMGGTSITETQNIIIDSTAPTLAITQPVGGELLAGGMALAIQWTPSTDANLGAAPISLEISSDGGGTWSSIATGQSNSGTYGWTTPASDGSTFQVRAKAEDLAGNSVYSSSADFTVDNTSPALALNTLNAGEILKGGAVHNITWTLTDTNLTANPVSLSYSSDGGTTWTSIAAGIANTGLYVWTVPSIDSANCFVKVTAADAVGHPAQAISLASFIIDSTAPIFTAATMDLNEGAATANNPYVAVDLQVIDALTNVTHFCLKTNSTVTPAVGDSCWRSVAANPPNLIPAPTLNLDNFVHSLGFTSGVKNVYAWAKNAVGNISALTGGGTGTSGQDMAAILSTYSLPPNVVDVLASNLVAHSDPPGPSDRVVNLATTVYIKWQASDDNPIANPISLDYTTDDINYTSITTGLLNGSNGGCVVDHATPASDDTMTGCYTWTSTVGGGTYFRIRVTYLDDSGQTDAGHSQGLNSEMTIVAGKMTTGINEDARQALFFPENLTTQLSDPESLVMKSNGDFYYRDSKRGLMYVSAATGILQQLIPVGPASTGDGGPASAATLRMPYKITLDQNENLLIFDYNRIRRLDTATNVITTFIGGGASAADGVLPANVLINPPSAIWTSENYKKMPFFVLPNGNVYFQSASYFTATPNEGARIRYYDNTDGLVKSFTFGGLGTALSAGQDVAECPLFTYAVAFDPTTSAIQKHIGLVGFRTGVCDTNYAFLGLNDSGVSTAPHPPTAAGASSPTAVGRTYTYVKPGRDGRIYAFSRFAARVYRYDHTANTWATIAGTGASGYCADGTVATACQLTVHDMHYGADNRIYLVDNGLIRYIDESNQIRTLYGTRGATLLQEGVSATTTYLGRIDSVQKRSSGELIFLDKDTVRFREVNTAGRVNTVAGNGATVGTITANVLATTTGLGSTLYAQFAVDPINGNIFYPGSSTLIYRLDRSTGMWSSVVGGGATNYTLADTLVGTDVSLPSLDPHRILGFDGTRLLVSKHFYNSGYFDSMLKLYDVGDSYRQSHLAGLVGGASTVFCGNGTVLAACGVPQSYSTDRYGQAQYVGGVWYILPPGTSAIRSLTPGGSISTLENLSLSATSFTYDSAGGRVFYCGTNGNLYQENLGSSATIIPLEQNLKCVGNGLTYDGTALYVPVADGSVGTYGILRVESL